MSDSIKVVSNLGAVGQGGALDGIEGIELAVATEREALLPLLADAEVFFAASLDAEMLRVGTNLRWIQFAAGGVEKVLFPELVASPVVLTCLKGCFAIPGAEHALAVMLAFARRLDYDIRQQSKRQYEWKDPIELAGKTVGIVGLGSMGREIARKASALDMRVVGLVRQPQAPPPFMEELFVIGQLHQLLAVSDFVVVAVPTTPGTTGLMGEAELRDMKPTSYLVDVSGRPGLYDLEALHRALRERWIAGANLQYVPPLDSPLWDLDNLIITYHRAVSDRTLAAALDLFRENLRRYRQGEPLLALVDKAAGY